MKVVFIKIAIDFKKDCREEYIEKLKRRGFDLTDNSSFGTVWVYGLSHIDYIKDRIEINQAGCMNFYDILLEDLEDFEIYIDD